MMATTKTELIAMVAERTGLEKGTTRNLIETLFDVIGDELADGNEVAIAGQVKFSYRVSKAIKKGTMTRNPFDGSTNPHPGRPAGLVVKAQALATLKRRAPGASTKVGKAIIAGKGK